MKDDKVHKDIIPNSLKKKKKKFLLKKTEETKRKSSLPSTNNNNDQREKYSSIKNKHSEYLAFKYKLYLSIFI